MKTKLLFSTLVCVAACGGDSKTHKLTIDQLKITVEVSSTAHDVDLIHDGENEGSAKEEVLSRVDITVPRLRMCRISIFPKGEDLTFEKRVDGAALKLFGIERELTQWHRKEKTTDGWVLDYEVTENGKPMRVITQRRTVAGRTFTCESGRIPVDDQTTKCAEVVARACSTLDTTAG